MGNISSTTDDMQKLRKVFQADSCSAVREWLAAGTDVVLSVRGAARK